jgi:CDP-6-deoxy-D-xylo-4-hexulose-3-dehydrase
VYVDVDINTFGITPENVKLFLEENPDNQLKAILPVHLMGYPVDMYQLNKIAKENNLITIEDSAQAHGSRLDDQKAGSLSLFSCFSFYVAHNIQAGEMGAINTNDPELLEYIQKMKSNGRVCSCRVCTRAKGFCPPLSNGRNNADPRFSHDIIGFNFKTMEFQAALGLVQLRRINEILTKRQENVKYLNEGLSEFSDVLQLPIHSNKISYLAYPIVLKKQSNLNREKLMEELGENGIETRPLFGCIPTQQPAYSFLKEKYKDKLSNAEYLGLNAFYVGCHQYLNQDDLDYVISIFKKTLKEK